MKLKDNGFKNVTENIEICGNSSKLVNFDDFSVLSWSETLFTETIIDLEMQPHYITLHKYSLCLYWNCGQRHYRSVGVGVFWRSHTFLRISLSFLPISNFISICLWSRNFRLPCYLHLKNIHSVSWSKLHGVNTQKKKKKKRIYVNELKIFAASRKQFFDHPKFKFDIINNHARRKKTISHSNFGHRIFFCYNENSLIVIIAWPNWNPIEFNRFICCCNFFFFVRLSSPSSNRITNW